MHSNSYTIIFTSVVTVILGGFLSVANGTLKEKQELNVENDSKKNILSSLGYVPNSNQPWTSDDITRLFERNIEVYVLNSKGARTNIDSSSINTDTDKENLPIYVDKKNDIVNGYAIPISGKGLWSTLYGYFAIEPDGITVKGITFYAHKETPGLGGEVEKLWFRNNFVGKKFIDQDGNLVGIKVIKGKANPDSPHEVDGISGATITSKGLESFLVEDLEKYEPFFRKIRIGEV
ncbi:MAG: NADH:ubiquinone reductase (Na(+)-transporting) subunit C [Candidatus Neomarinimicrobiota bacterium]